MQKRNSNCTLSLLLSDDGSILRIELGGEIDHHSAIWVRSEIDALIAKERPRKSVIDLSKIEFMDSSGIGLIMGRYTRMQAVGGELFVSRPNERVMKIFLMAGLDRLVKIETEEEANEANKAGKAKQR